MATADAQVLVQLMTLVGLMGATIQYSHLIRRRAVRRKRAAFQHALDESGVRGLVRVFLVDPIGPRP